jgi:hypothetical protein
MEIYEYSQCHPNIRKTSQQAVCRFCEALCFAHAGGGHCFAVSLQQQIFAYVQAQHSNLLLQATVNSNTI